MPVYEFKNSETNEIVEKILRISEYDQFVKDNPELVRHYSTAPSLTSDSISPLTRAGKEWENHLSNIKKNSGRDNTIKV
jgi:hypothetical protein